MLEQLYYMIFIITMLFMFFICYFMFVEESSTKPDGLYDEHIGNYRMAIPMIAINLVFLTLLAFGTYNIEQFAMNTTDGLHYTYALQSTPTSDYVVMSVIFFFLFLTHGVLFFKNVVDIMREGTASQGKHYVH